MNRVAVINVVGLSESLLGSHTPQINAFRDTGALRHIKPAFPALTCSAQSNYLTGQTPAVHGIVGNGWYNRELAEVHFWKQSNHLVGHRKIWEDLRAANPNFTCAKLFWWFNMYSGADWSITPRPMYPADGRKVFDIYAWPFSVREQIKRDLGDFPFHTFWGPSAGINGPAGASDAATRWIAEAAKWVENQYAPTLNLVYLPHLDYNLQRLGPTNSAISEDLRKIDQIAGDLIEFFRQRSVEVILLSEYGISEVDTPVHLNRLFRQKGWLTVKDELGRELLDYGAIRVFAVADHQVAHVYLKDPALELQVRSAMESCPGVAAVWGASEKHRHGIDHARAGDLVALAQPRAWFTYYYWVDDRRAPDFARTVDIHRKPGYDPVELFLDPSIRLIKGRIVWRLAQKKLGFRMLMDVIPLDATLVKGSHGAIPADSKEWPVLICKSTTSRDQAPLESTSVYDVILKAVTG